MTIEEIINDWENIKNDIDLLIEELRLALFLYGKNPTPEGCGILKNILEAIRDIRQKSDTSGDTIENILKFFQNGSLFKK